MADVVVNMVEGDQIKLNLTFEAKAQVFLVSCGDVSEASRKRARDSGEKVTVMRPREANSSNNFIETYDVSTGVVQKIKIICITR